MKPEQYKAMVEMLITATQNRKLSWNEADGDFYTDIDGCTLWICTNYDFSVNSSSYILKLFNDNNVQFETFSYSDEVNSDEYQQLDLLYNTIRDVLYKITESENAILKRLTILTTQTVPSKDELPF